MSNKVYVGQKCASFESKGEFPPVSRVTMHVDDERYFTAGDDTGRTIELTCRAATQKIVDNILEKLRGFVYRPYEAKGAVLDPRVELGDAVTIGGIYSIIASRTTNLATPGISDISAPGALETGHEYKYLTPTERELKKRIKEGYKYQGVQIDRLNGLTITETDGETQGAKVVLNSKELTFYDVCGGKVLYFDPVSKTYKFMGELNVNDKFIVDKLGNVRVSGNMIFAEESIVTWGTKGPVKYKFAVSITGPWHDTMQANDKYRRDSLDGGTTWGDPYQFVGTDGKPGSDASVPGYIKQTYIDMTGVTAPYIKANKMEVVCPSGAEYDTETGFILTGAYGKYELRYLRIHSFPSDPPSVVFSSPQGCDGIFDFTNIKFRKHVDFSEATVTGATFVLA